MSRTSFEEKKRRALKHLAPGQTTFITHAGVTYPVYRAPKKAGDRDL
jgi:hypothetical protein